MSQGSTIELLREKVQERDAIKKEVVELSGMLTKANDRWNRLGQILRDLVEKEDSS